MYIPKIRYIKGAPKSYPVDQHIIICHFQKNK